MKRILWLTLLLAPAAFAQKISQLPTYPQPLTGSELIPASNTALSSTNSYTITPAQIQAYLESHTNTWTGLQNFTGTVEVNSVPLARSATVDTTDASNITTSQLPSLARLPSIPAYTVIGNSTSASAAPTASTTLPIQIGGNTILCNNTASTASPTACAAVSSLVAGGTAATVSGCGTPAVTGGSFAGAFTAGATSCSPVITTGISAPHGWHCRADDETTAITFRETAHTTTSATLTASGSATTSDVIDFSCVGF